MARKNYWITSPKWQPVKHLIIDGCSKNDVTFKELSYERGFLSNTLSFEVSGDPDNLKNFDKAITSWGEEHGYC